GCSRVWTGCTTTLPAPGSVRCTPHARPPSWFVTFSSRRSTKAAGPATTRTKARCRHDQQRPANQPKRPSRTVGRAGAVKGEAVRGKGRSGLRPETRARKKEKQGRCFRRGCSCTYRFTTKRVLPSFSARF
ncbi:unnamed protein product, partial [Ectocarpus sp. 12 AP-2014]